MQLGLGEVTAAEKLAAVWVASEAAFYLVQTAIASQASDRHSPFTGVAQWSPGRRRELWRRLLATQPAAEYLSSWLYREPSFPTPATLLLGWSGVPGFPSPRAAAAAAARSFRGVGWEEITEGDAYEWGARALFAAPSLAALTPAQEEELRALISELEQAAGKALAAGGPTPGVKSMCAQMDRLQWSSRPLLYYALSDGLVQAAYAAPKMRSLGYTRRRTGELGYYYRRGRGAAAEPASSAEARGGERGAPSAADAFVFVHGIGVGPAVYADVLERMVCDDTPVVAVETDAISQKLFPAAALSPDRFAQLLDRALAELGVERAVICGHSYGTALVSYALNRDRHRRRPRLCGAVLLDPIATLLHHSTTTRAPLRPTKRGPGGGAWSAPTPAPCGAGEFVYRPASGLADAIADYLFKKELWTSRAVSRSIVFHEASFFLEDCSARRPTLIAVSDDDAIVAPDAIAGRFGTWQSRLAGVQVLRMAGIGHGGWIEDDPAQGDRLVAAVQDLRRQVSNIGRLEGVPRLGAEAVRGVVTPTRGLQRAILRRQRHSRRARKLAPL